MNRKRLSLLLIPLAGLLNWVRGRGIVKGDRWWMSAILGAGYAYLSLGAVALSTTGAIQVTLITAGIYLLLAGGWVQAFASFTGRKPEMREGTFRFLNKPVAKLCGLQLGQYWNAGQARKFGTIWACLRFGLGSIPLCGAMAWHSSPVCLAFPLLFALCGLIMAATRWVPERYAFYVFEPLIGAWIGSILWLGMA